MTTVGAVTRVVAAGMTKMFDGHPGKTLPASRAARRYFGRLVYRNRVKRRIDPAANLAFLRWQAVAQKVAAGEKRRQKLAEDEKAFKEKTRVEP